MLRKLIFSCAIILITVGFVKPVRASEINLSVSGNGDSSSNQANTQTKNDATVTQSNNAKVTNNTNSTSDSGNNKANANTTSQTTIHSGSSTANTTVNNNNINNNTAQNVGCGCKTNTQIAVANNGQGSTNAVNATSITNTTVTQSNNAAVTNTPQLSSNSGGNNANSNTGNTTINTGKVGGNIQIENKNINQNIDPEPSGSSSTTTILVDKNGANSVNIVNFTSQADFNYVESNIADIINDPILNLDSGNNNADKNNGDTTILTGDVLGQVIIENDKVNENFKKTNKSPETPPTTPTPPQTPIIPPLGPQIGGGSSPNPGGNGSNTSVLAAATGEMLPATGSNFLFLFTLLAIGLFFAGLYLRLHSGYAPPKVAK